MPLGEEIPLERGHQRGPLVRNRYFISINLCSVTTVADKHRLAAYHNKQCWRSFREYQCRWPWTTKYKNSGFLVNFRHFRSQRIFQEWIGPDLL